MPANRFLAFFFYLKHDKNSDYENLWKLVFFLLNTGIFSFVAKNLVFLKKLSTDFQNKVPQENSPILLRAYRTP